MLAALAVIETNQLHLWIVTAATVVVVGVIVVVVVVVVMMMMPAMRSAFICIQSLRPHAHSSSK